MLFILRTIKGHAVRETNHGTLVAGNCAVLFILFCNFSSFINLCALVEIGESFISYAQGVNLSRAGGVLLWNRSLVVAAYSN